LVDNKEVAPSWPSGTLRAYVARRRTFECKSSRRFSSARSEPSFDSWYLEV
jgi:hypothetical protein